MPNSVLSRGYWMIFVPEANIVYLTVSSWFLISFVMGGGGAAWAGRLSSFMHLSGPSRAVKFFYTPAPTHPLVWALKPPSQALVNKTTYAPMIYTALCIMFWGSVHIHYLGNWEGVGPWKSQVFLALAYRLNAISQGPKTLDFQGPFHK